MTKIITIIMIVFTALVITTDSGFAANDIIYGCITKLTGNLRIVSIPTQCRFNESPIQWNITGPAGLPGATGPAGPQGPIGPVGATGAPGAVGATGATGPIGPAGAAGAAGPAGPIGLPGAPGVQGAQGIQGPAGEPGTDGADGWNPVVAQGNVDSDGTRLSGTGPWTCVRSNHIAWYEYSIQLEWATGPIPTCHVTQHGLIDRTDEYYRVEYELKYDTYGNYFLNVYSRVWEPSWNAWKPFPAVFSFTCIQE